MYYVLYVCIVFYVCELMKLICQINWVSLAIPISFVCLSVFLFYLLVQFFSIYSCMNSVGSMGILE